GLMEGWRFYRYWKRGWKISADRFKLLVHGVPSLWVAAMPAGAMTNWWGPQSFFALLDFPTAKVMASIWLAYTLWSAWEVTLP
ncbi:MAG: hypothetical protein ACYCT0_06930, partial [Sulfobacillus sp.]